MLTKENSKGFHAAIKYPICVFRAFDAMWIRKEAPQGSELIKRVNNEDEHFDYYKELLEHEFRNVSDDDDLNEKNPVMCDEIQRRNGE